ncbi:MAG: hypothetical protein IPF82_03965 [Blastocatellia bacterium]|nr:hypothetical protein [Blastocatellia bacterium]
MKPTAPPENGGQVVDLHRQEPSGVAAHGNERRHVFLAALAVFLYPDLAVLAVQEHVRSRA